MGEPRGKPFEVGNTFGRERPRGSRNKTALRMQELLAESGEAIMEKLIADALGGDKGAMRLCIERLLPPVKDLPIDTEIGPLQTWGEVAMAREKILEGMKEGELTISDAKACLEIITRLVRD